MPKDKILTCPTCGYKYKQVNEEVAVCAGKRKPSSVGHKSVRMR